jgi:hypothetical protein
MFPLYEIIIIDVPSNTYHINKADDTKADDTKDDVVIDILIEVVVV